MAEKPEVALAVSDLESSIEFYTERLGFRPGRRPTPEMAEIMAAEDDVMLLTGPEAGDILPYMAERHFIATPGGDPQIFATEDIEVTRAALVQKGLEPTPVEQTRWGDRTIELHDPDGYRIRFYTPAEHTPEEVMALYVTVPDELEGALQGLSEDDLEMKKEPDSWSIRHIVHHLADTETLFVWWMKLTLSEPGRDVIQNWPSSNEATGRMGHDQRPIAPSVALIRAMHGHIQQLAEYTPMAWEQATKDETGRDTNFGSLVSIVTQHALEHIDGIMQTRRVRGL